MPPPPSPPAAAGLLLLGEGLSRRGEEGVGVGVPPPPIGREGEGVGIARWGGGDRVGGGCCWAGWAWLCQRLAGRGCAKEGGFGPPQGVVVRVAAWGGGGEGVNCQAPQPSLHLTARLAGPPTCHCQAPQPSLHLTAMLPGPPT